MSRKALENYIILCGEEKSLGQPRFGQSRGSVCLAPEWSLVDIFLAQCSPRTVVGTLHIT